MKHIRNLSKKKILTPILLGLFLCIFLFISGQKALARTPNERLITIYNGDVTQTVVTTATTVKEVLDRTGIVLRDHDAVEPGLNTELVASDYSLNIYQARPVTVIDGANRYTVMSPYQSPHKIASSAGVVTHAEDNLELTRVDDFLSDEVGLKLDIDRATQMRLVLFGQTMDIRTQALTVGELLAEKKVVLGENDGSSLPLHTPIAADMKLEIWRDGIQTIKEEKEAEFPIEQIKDKDRDVGFREIRTRGVKGKKVVVYEIEMKDGKEVRRTELQSVVTEQPQKQVEIVGTKTLGVASDFNSALVRLRQCEAGGRYDRNSGNGYYGAYQFSASSWRSWAPAAYKGVMAHEAPPEAQDQAVWSYYQKSGWRPWPGCTTKLGLQDIYR